MSGPSAYEKKYVDPKDQSQVEGLLEHFNLPPKVIRFLRENKRQIQIALAVTLIAIVTVSLYGSYKEKRVEKAASALTLAEKETGDAQIAAFEKVASEFDDTASGVWAKVELAHLEMKEKNYDSAAQKYSDVSKGLKADSPLYPLTLVGLAEAYEAQQKYDESYAAFESLKTVNGYELTAYAGMARIHETRGEFDQAMGIYGQYLAVIGEEPGLDAQRAYVDEKIARIKAQQ